MVDFSKFVDEKPKDRVVSAKKGLIDAIQFDDNGTEHKIQYEAKPPCYSCGRDNMWSGQSSGCPVCDGLMTEAEYNESQKEAEVVLDLTSDIPEIPDIPPNKEYTIEATLTTEKEATFQMVEEPIITFEPEPKEEEPMEAEIVEKKEPTKALAINTKEQQLPNIQNITSIPSIQEVDTFLAMYKHVKNAIVDKSDFHTYKKGQPPRMKKSGWRKFIKPFNLSVELIREEDLGKENPRLFEFGTGPDGKPDVHAEVWVRVSVTHVSCKECGFEVQGQFIEALGYKSKSEYWSPNYQTFGSYDLHNLITTARTRGQNIGISDLVGFGEVSAEEIKGGIK